MRLKERITWAVVVLFTVGFGMLSAHFGVAFCIPFCLLGLFAAGILMRDEKNWKWGSILLILIYAVARSGVGMRARND